MVPAQLEPVVKPRPAVPSPSMSIRRVRRSYFVSWTNLAAAPKERAADHDGKLPQATANRSTSAFFFDVIGTRSCPAMFF